MSGRASDCEVALTVLASPTENSRACLIVRGVLGWTEMGSPSYYGPGLSISNTVAGYTASVACHPAALLTAEW